jgi:hypothetical protein
MRFVIRWMLAAGCAGCAGCAVPDVLAHYPAAPGAPTGTLVLRLTQPASDVAVAIDGVMVVDGAHTGRVVVDHVPQGTREVILAANGADKAFRVWIGGDHATAVPLGVPDEGISFWKALAATLITIAAYALLR